MKHKEYKIFKSNGSFFVKRKNWLGWYTENFLDSLLTEYSIGCNSYFSKRFDTVEECLRMIDLSATYESTHVLDYTSSID